MLMDQNIRLLFEWYLNQETNIKKIGYTDETYSVLVKHRLENIFIEYLRLNNTGIDDFKVLKVQNDWEEKHRNYASIMSDLVKEIDKYSLKYTIVKGFALSIRNYYHCSHRKFSDVDIIIDRKELQLVKVIMSKVGFKLEEEGMNNKLYRYEVNGSIHFFDINFTPLLFNRFLIHDGYQILNNEEHFIYIADIVYREINNGEPLIFNKFLDLLLLLKESNIRLISEISLKTGQFYVVKEVVNLLYFEYENLLTQKAYDIFNADGKKTKKGNVYVHIHGEKA